MRKTIRKTITLFAAALVITSLFSACAQQTEKASEDLSIIYEGYSSAESTLLNDEGEAVNTRCCYFVIENTADEELRSAKYRIIGMDENGEELQRSDGVSSRSIFFVIPYLKPGERTYGSILDAEWTETPANYKVEIFNSYWGTGDGIPLSVVDVTAGGGPYARKVTIRNDGEEEYQWMAGYGEGLPEGSRLANLIAVYKDSDGNVTGIDEALLMDENDNMLEQFTLAPGEEKTLTVIIDNPDSDCEFMVCWRQ